jgi:hypothetical protein
MNVCTGCSWRWADGNCQNPQAPFYRRLAMAGSCSQRDEAPARKTLPPSRDALFASAKAILRSGIPEIGAVGDLLKAADRMDLAGRVYEAKKSLDMVLDSLKMLTHEQPPMAGGGGRR